MVAGLMAGMMPFAAPATRRLLQPPIQDAQPHRAASKRLSRAVELARHRGRAPGSLPGWPPLILQHGAEGAAADFPQYRIVFGVGQEHEREVQCAASGPRPQGVAGPAADAAGRLVGRPEAGMTYQH
jgi:hypothetical protein